MVLAVQTRAPPGTADYACNGRSVPLLPADPARPVVAALMQVGPGVAPSSSLRPTLFSESQPLF